MMKEVCLQAARLHCGQCRPPAVTTILSFAPRVGYPAETGCLLGNEGSPVLYASLRTASCQL